MTVTVSLSAELAEFVESKVASGEFASQSDVLAEALKLLQQRDAHNEPSLTSLQDAWKSGLESGDFQALDFSALKAEARTRLSKG
ncbi:type II toxin-antitoxin system ParD family antitoxin [Agrobacterium sp. a22-2]|uniref:type II toxin-antitoxin system ParD family antitoxin n=1 Tax=Agrobacterium sp. a22-2 TaxID=2283840 RepID=UPI0014471C32|nr:type II toxin-antitoxin system ParD family antitoxin [Agrobacterium sp. a22-2]NKN38602.1 type II toxin-antitoxin system ParD family antitoxin [Agrobacterium sp. a22-2]